MKPAMLKIVTGLVAAYTLAVMSVGVMAQTGETIGISVQQLRDPYFISIIYGAQKAADEAGVKLIIHEAGGYGNVDRQIAQIEDLIQKKVSMMIVMPTNSRGVAPVVNRAISKGIPAMHMGSKVATDKMIAFVQSDDHELGAAQARYVKEKIGDKANLIYIAGPPGVTWTKDRWKGYKSIVDTNSGHKVLDTLWIDSSREAALKKTEDMLQTYKNLTSIGASGDFMTLGAGDAIKAAGKVGKIILTTAGMSKDAEDMIRNGVIQMTAAQQVVQIGYVGVKTAVQYLRKEKYSKHTIIPPIIVTKENVDKVDVNNIRHPDSFRPKLIYP